MCTNCWKKISDFHEFYGRVDVATNEFLKTHTKGETLPFVEVKCDEIDVIENESVIVKKEVSDIMSTEAEPQLLQPSPSPLESDDADEENIENDQREKEIDHFNVERSNESDNDDGHELDTNITATPISTANGKIQNFDHLMPQYMSMTCDICDYPFKSMSGAFTHYRKEHQTQKIHIKCCDCQLRMRDVKDHIRYHLDPDVFK